MKAAYQKGNTVGLKEIVTMTNAESLPLAVAPDHSNLVYSGFIELLCTPEAAFGVRPVADTLFGKDTPGAVVRFRMVATEAEALIEYAPKASLTKRINYQGTGVVLKDGRRTATFDRLSDAGGVVRVRLAADDGEPHTWGLVLPYADPVVFRGLRLTAGGQLLVLPPVAERSVYVAYGDSITHGFLAGDALSGYAWQLAETMGWQLVNLGFGNRTAVPDDARLVTAMNPDVVTVLLGANDCYGCVPVDAFAQNYGAILDTIHERRPTALIVVITPLSVPGLREGWEKLENLEDYRKALRKLIATRNDNRLLLVEGPTLIPSEPGYFADGLHPNDKGFAVMADRLAAEIIKAGVKVEPVR
ncbi:MAG: SGNH/GDSL hydrolase family protein [Kiritimatiellaeota bacterium]|nr:SGNH/GDSL hydrolase family protein [Kiritimatiellota bacterium]